MKAEEQKRLFDKIFRILISPFHLKLVGTPCNIVSIKIRYLRPGGSVGTGVVDILTVVVGVVVVGSAFGGLKSQLSTPKKSKSSKAINPNSLLPLMA